MVISFAGHSFVPDHNRIEEIAKEEIRNNITKEECDNCPYHKLCDFMLDLQDIILL